MEHCYQSANIAKEIIVLKIYCVLIATHQVFKVSLAKYMGLSLAFREVELSNYLQPIPYSVSR